MRTALRLVQGAQTCAERSDLRRALRVVQDARTCAGRSDLCVASSDLYFARTLLVRTLFCSYFAIWGSYVARALLVGYYFGLVLCSYFAM